jgi:hypothetical protein
MRGYNGEKREHVDKVTQRFRTTHEAIPFLYHNFPNLRDAKWRIKSPCDDVYQCIAWAAWYTDRYMWPHQDYWWFPGTPLFAGFDYEATPDYFIAGFSSIGYRPCTSRKFEFGFQKVAIYANDAGVTHMARQRLFGFGWLSKLGTRDEDIYHAELGDIEGEMSATAGQYGRVVQVLRRSWWAAIKYRCISRAIRITRELREYRRTHKWEAP